MYIVITTIEKILRGVKVLIKLCYYKLKYGKRLNIGKNNHFRKGFIINIAKNGRLSLGSNNFFNNYCSINCRKMITIGNNNLFGENVKIYDHNHVFDDESSDIKKTFKESRVSIGNSNWICSNVVILKNAIIHNNTVIGAGVVVNEAVDSKVVVTNNRKNKVEPIRYKKNGKTE